MNPIFAAPVRGVISLDNAYSLATLLRANQYVAPLYRDAWAAANGFASCVREDPGFPPPYSVAYSADGVVVALGGLQNFSQFTRLYNNSGLCSMYGVPGKVCWYLRDSYEKIQADLLSKIALAPATARIVVCGFSAGGALAPIVAQRLNAIYGAGRVKYCVTLGAPKPGNQEFAAGLTFQTLCIENEGDPVPDYPLADGVLSSLLTGLSNYRQYAYPGDRLALLRDGDTALLNPGNSSSAVVPVIVNTIASVGADPLGSDHYLTEYMRRLAFTVRVTGPETYVTKSWRIGQAMTFGVAPADFSTPTDPPPTAPIPTPTAPTVAQIQAPPTGPGGPSDPTPVYDTALVGSTQRVTSLAVVSRTRRPGDDINFHGLDRRKITNAIISLQAMGRRDSLLYRGKKSRILRNTRDRQTLVGAALHLNRIKARDLRNEDPKPTLTLSTRAYMINPDDIDTVGAINNVLTAIQAAVTAADPTRPFIDRSNAPLTDDFENLLVHFRALYYFGPLGG